MAAVFVGLGAALVLAVAAQARGTTNPILSVAFVPDGTISVTTGDGTTVGTSSGAPTVIPAGYYTQLFSGIEDCGALPYFHLGGPGVDIVTEVNGEPNASLPASVYLLPASTYSWSDAAAPDVVYQFTTSTQVVGSPPKAPVRAPGTFTSHDIVGSDLPPVAGSLRATIAANGKVVLLHDGKRRGKLRPGRYRLTVTSHDPRSGFAIERPASHTVALARGAFSGKRSLSVRLTAGTWIFVGRPGKASLPFVVGEP